NCIRVYYKSAVAAIVVYDITRQDTFESVKAWKNDIDSKVHLPGTENESIPCILIANKADLPKTVSLTEGQLHKYCKENGFIGWFETSAKKGSNVNEAVKSLIDHVFLKHMSIVQPESVGDQIDRVDILHKKVEEERSESRCCLITTSTAND